MKVQDLRKKATVTGSITISIINEKKFSTIQKLLVDSWKDPSMFPEINNMTIQQIIIKPNTIQIYVRNS